MPAPKRKDHRADAETSLNVAITFLQDGAFLDAARCAAQAIQELMAAYAERYTG